MAYQFDFSSLLNYQDVIVRGIYTTVELTAVGGILGGFVSVIGAWARTQGPTWLKAVFTAYVELIRNTPFLVQLFFIFFGLPGIGIRINEMEAAFLAMTINLGAYGTEIVRAGVSAISKGQIEAAQSLAMTRGQVFRYVILRPALQKVWPAFSSQLVIVMLGSAVCSQIAVEDLSFAANFIQWRNFRAFEAYTASTLIYLVMAILLRKLLAIFGERVVLARRTR